MMATSRCSLGFKDEQSLALTGCVRAATPDSERSSAAGSEFLPSFFVIGPPRTGTSWVHEILRGRTALPEATKETRFFDTHFHRGMKWYRAHFPHLATEQRVGEIAPTYFASTLARERIARTVPHARIICIFRNPVDRVLSLYRVKRAYGMIPWKFEQALIHDPELMESSRYATHLRDWLRIFGGHNVHVGFYEDLRDRSQVFVDELADFIGLPRFALTASQVRRIHTSESMTHPRSYYRTRGATLIAEWCKAQRLHTVVAAVKRSPLLRLFLGGGAPFSDLPLGAVQNLYELFRPEMEELEVLLSRDLTPWKFHESQIAAVAD